MLSGSGVSCGLTLRSKCADAPRVFLRGRSHVGPRSNCSWSPKCRNICSCCGFESVRGQVRMPSFWMRRRLPIGSKSTGWLDNKSCDCGVVVVEHFRFELRIGRSNHYPLMLFSH